MKETIYVIYDNGAQIALKPFIISRNDVVPVREFQQIANDKNSIINKHPDDFHLIAIGEIDLEKMELSGYVPQLISTAKQLMEGEEE